jgi:hypothetical protein
MREADDQWLDRVKEAINKSKEGVMTPTITQLSKPEKVIYRTTTGIVCAVMIFSIINFIFNDHFPIPMDPKEPSSIWDCPATSRSSSQSPRYLKY